MKGGYGKNPRRLGAKGGIWPAERGSLHAKGASRPLRHGSLHANGASRTAMTGSLHAKKRAQPSRHGSLHAKRGAQLGKKRPVDAQRGAARGRERFVRARQVGVAERGKLFGVRQAESAADRDVLPAPGCRSAPHRRCPRPCSGRQMKTRLTGCLGRTAAASFAGFSPSASRDRSCSTSTGDHVL